MILSGICDERILVLSQNLVWWSWTFLGAGHFKINNPAPSVGRPLPNCYVLAPATPDHGCRGALLLHCRPTGHDGTLYRPGRATKQTEYSSHFCMHGAVHTREA